MYTYMCVCAKQAHLCLDMYVSLCRLCMCIYARNKKSLIFADISSKYRISVGTDTILLTESQLIKKSVKSLIFR